MFDIPLLAERLVAVPSAGSTDSPSLLGCRSACSAPAPERRRRWSLRHSLAPASARWCRVAAAPTSPAPRSTDVTAPTLLIVGGHDDVVIELNEQAFARLMAPKAIEIVPGATHLFPEPGAIEAVIELAARWFKTHLGGAAHAKSDVAAEPEMPFIDRNGRRTASSPRRSRLTRDQTAGRAGLAARRRAGRGGNRRRARRPARPDPGAQDRRAVSAGACHGRGGRRRRAAGRPQ